MEFWHPRLINCHEQTPDKQRTPAARALHGTQQDQKCSSSTTESEPPLPVPSHVGTGRTMSTWGHPSWDATRRTCWGQAATHSGFHFTQLSQHVLGTGSIPAGRGSTFPKTTERWGSTLRREQASLTKLSQDGEDSEFLTSQGVSGWRGH